MLPWKMESWFTVGKVVADGWIDEVEGLVFKLMMAICWPLRRDKESFTEGSSPVVLISASRSVVSSMLKILICELGVVNVATDAAEKQLLNSKAARAVLTRRHWSAKHQQTTLQKLLILLVILKISRSRSAVWELANETNLLVLPENY